MKGTIDLGLSVATAADSWKVVQRAEALGYTRAWFYDTQMLNADVLVAMGAAAVKTSKIRLATGVLIPSNRIAPVAANALASLNALAPGRIDFGISTGFTARRSLGLGPVKLADMKEYIRIVQRLLAGETTEWNFEGEQRKIRFLNPEIDTIKIDDSIPLHISAVGPKARALTVELDAHWMYTAGNQVASVAAIEAMSSARRNAGCDPARYIATAQVGGCVLADGETYESPRVQVQAGPHATVALHNMVEAEQFGNFGRGLPDHLAPLLEQYRKIYLQYAPADARYLSNHRGHLMFLRPEEKALCTPDLIRATTMSGTKAELRDRIRALRDAGYNHLAVHIRHGQPQMLEDWADVFAMV